MTTDEKTNESTIADELLERVADVLVALNDVGAGDYSTRLRTELPEDHPMWALYTGINEMIASLEGERERGLAYQRDLEEKLATIEAQREAIRELSTPIMEVWEGVLCLPIVGALDSSRSAEMTEALLRAIVDKKARCAILDVTGIQVIETATADHFIRMAKAVALLGARCMLTGVNPSIAQTVVHIGAELGDIEVYRTLRNALQAHVALRAREGVRHARSLAASRRT